MSVRRKNFGQKIKEKKKLYVGNDNNKKNAHRKTNKANTVWNLIEYERICLFLTAFNQCQTAFDFLSLFLPSVFFLFLLRFSVCVFFRKCLVWFKNEIILGGINYHQFIRHIIQFVKRVNRNNIAVYMQIIIQTTICFCMRFYLENSYA